MSIQSVREIVSDLPRSLGDQVIGYAESVERALPEIFAEAGRQRTESLSAQIIFIAGLKKLHWLIASAYWTLDNSETLLSSMDVSHIHIGSADVSRGGKIFRELNNLLSDMDRMFENKQIGQYLHLTWPELIRVLGTNER